MAEWPDTVPACPILNGFSEEPQVNVGSFKPEVGPPKARRRSTARCWLSEFTFRMTNAEASTFWGFYIDTLYAGTASFGMAHPPDKVEYSWMFVPGEVPKAVRASPTTQTITFRLLRLP